MAVGLLSAEKKRSRWASCSGVTRERLRFSLPSPDLEVGDRVARPRWGPEEGSLGKSTSGESGEVAEARESSPGVGGDFVEAVWDEADELGRAEVSCSWSLLESMCKGGILARVLRLARLSKCRSLADGR